MRRILRSSLVRWSGLVCSGVLLAALLASACLHVSLTWRDSDDQPRGIVLFQGRVLIWRDPMMATPTLGWQVERLDSPRLNWWITTFTMKTARWRADLVAIPLWWPLVVVGVPTMVAWRMPMRLMPSSRRRERSARGLCWKCGYDLAGLSPCPECGATGGTGD